ncbi:MAG: TonB family protein [Oscillatoria sp. PMC 1068.18]|nr:TonB family protein [Oscillatoria sp. PMC 1068.18]
MSYSSIIKTLPDKLTQPATLAAFASVGIHGLLGVSLPNLPLFSATTDQAALRDVKLVELSEAEQSRLPDLSPQLDPSELPHLSKLLPVNKTAPSGNTPAASTSLPSTPTKNLSIDKSVTLGRGAGVQTKVPLPAPPPLATTTANPNLTNPGKTQYEIERSQRLSLFANSSAHTQSTQTPKEQIQARIDQNNARDIARINNSASTPPITNATKLPPPPPPNLVQPNNDSGNNNAIAPNQTIPSNTPQRDDTVPTFGSNSSDAQPDEDLTTALLDPESYSPTNTTEDKKKQEKNLAAIAEQLTNSSSPEEDENQQNNPQTSPTIPTNATPVTPSETAPKTDSTSSTTRQQLNIIQQPNPVNTTTPSNSNPQPQPTNPSTTTPAASANNSASTPTPTPTNTSPANSLNNIQADPSALQQRIQNLETEPTNSNNQQTKINSPTWKATVAQIPPQEEKLTGIYPENACAKKLTGNVIYGVLIDSQGNIADLELIKGTAYPIFNQQAREQIQQRTFSPASGQLQPYQINVEFKYNQANCPA